MFRTKICGVTNEADAVLAIDAGADAIGLNFYASSPRSVTRDASAAIAAAIADRALRVGVFVNESAAAIGELVEAASLEAIQLHGDEPPEFVADLPDGTPVIRATRMGDDGLRSVARYLEACAAAGRSIAAVLVDAPRSAAGEYGGTGRVADWARVANERHWLGDSPLILAGGLTPTNVGEAIRAVGPEGVDTASGVESSPGRKDADLVRRFVAEATAAFGAG